jgi:hypothetical protein
MKNDPSVKKCIELLSNYLLKRLKQTGPLVRAHPKMVDFGSGQGLTTFKRKVDDAAYGSQSEYGPPHQPQT